MLDIANGVWIADRLVAWGTTLEDAARAFGQGAGEISSKGVCLPRGLACGLPVLSARLSGPAADRPVLGVEYDLADVGGFRADDWLAAATDLLGPPESVDRRDPAGRQRPEDAVILGARWWAGEFGAGLSIFGGPRPVAHGCAIGSFWLSWRHEAAAEPYLADWTRRSAQLSASADTLTDIHVHSLAWPAQPCHGHGEQGLETGEGRQNRHLRLCLHAPELLETPDAVARRLNASRFAIWFHQPSRFWCVSTLWDSLATSFDTATSLTWIEMAPGRGTGFSALEIGRWAVSSSEGSADIAEAVERIAAFPGITILRHQGCNS